MLTPEQENLIHDNLKLVHKAANDLLRRVIDPAISYDDLYSEGCIGLISAVRKFDKHLKFKFSTYAYRTIQGYILRSIHRPGFIAVPFHIIDAAKKVRRLELERCEPDEIVKALECSMGTAIQALHYLGVRYVSMHAPISGDEESRTYGDIALKRDDHSVLFVDEFLEGLTPRQRFVLDRIRVGKKYREIAEEMGLSRQIPYVDMVEIRKASHKYQSGVAL
jgi:RNA polymerase sigma factor (sigma-70 family)